MNVTPPSTCRRCSSIRCGMDRCAQCVKETGWDAGDVKLEFNEEEAPVTQEGVDYWSSKYGGQAPARPAATLAAACPFNRRRRRGSAGNRAGIVDRAVLARGLAARPFRELPAAHSWWSVTMPRARRPGGVSIRVRFANRRYFRGRHLVTSALRTRSDSERNICAVRVFSLRHRTPATRGPQPARVPAICTPSPRLSHGSGIPGTAARYGAEERPARARARSDGRPPGGVARSACSPRRPERHRATGAGGGASNCPLPKRSSGRAEVVGARRERAAAAREVAGPSRRQVGAAPPAAPTCCGGKLAGGGGGSPAMPSGARPAERHHGRRRGRGRRGTRRPRRRSRRKPTAAAAADADAPTLSAAVGCASRGSGA